MTMQPPGNKSIFRFSMSDGEPLAYIVPQRRWSQSDGMEAVSHIHSNDVPMDQPIHQQQASKVTYLDTAPTRKVSKASQAGSHHIRESRRVSFGEESALQSIETIGDSIVGSDKTLMHSIGGDGTTWLGGILIMANVCIGMALLNFPRTIAVAGGLLPAFIISTVFLLLIIFSLGMTAYCCRYYGSVNYQDMVVTNCGRVAGYFCKAFLLLETLGSCIVKLVVFADQLDRIVRIIHGNEFNALWYLRRNFTMPMVTTLTILPFCLMKNFQIFKYTSAFGILAALFISFGVAVVRYYTGVEMPTHVVPVSGAVDYVALLPLLVYAFHGHVEAPVVFCCLKRNRIFYFMRMVYGYLFLAVIIYAVCAVFGYLTFGRFADEDLLLSFPNDDTLVNVAMFLVIVKLFTSFPVVFYILRSVVEDFCRGNLHHCLPRVFRNAEIRRVTETLILFTFCVTVAAVVPNLNSAIHLIGGISCNLAFTFPGLCFMMIHVDKDQKILKHRVRIVIGAVYIMIGVFLTGTNTTYAIMAYLKENQ